MTYSRAQDFDAAWRTVEAIPGWLTRDQAQLLFETATEMHSGAQLVEIGSHQGKSTIVLAAAAETSSARVLAIDPFVEGKLFGGISTRAKFEQNIAESGLADTIDLLAEYSTRARPAWDKPIDYLYIDGKHDYWTLSDDLKWSEHLPTGAPVLIHDCFSSIGVTLGILVNVLFSGRIRYERRAGSLALFRVGRPSFADRARILKEVPWWIRNVAVKVLLRLRLNPLAKAIFGHEGPYDPF